jgi:hypothetical protein
MRQESVHSLFMFDPLQTDAAVAQGGIAARADNWEAVLDMVTSHKSSYMPAVGLTAACACGTYMYHSSVYTVATVSELHLHGHAYSRQAAGSVTAALSLLLHLRLLVCTAQLMICQRQTPSCVQQHDAVSEASMW